MSFLHSLLAAHSHHGLSHSTAATAQAAKAERPRFVGEVVTFIEVVDGFKTCLFKNMLVFLGVSGCLIKCINLPM